MLFQQIIRQFFGASQLVFAALTAIALPAGAAPLSPVASLVGCVVNPTVVQNPTSCSVGSGGATAVASATLPFVSLTASAFSPAGSATHADATAGMTYFFQVTGGIVGDVVPLLIGVTLTTTSTEAQSPKSYAQANFTRFTSIDGLVTGPQVCTYVTICGSLVTSFSGPAAVHAASGSSGDFVNLTVEAVAQAGFGTTDEAASAFADPIIIVDPSFPNASLYSVIVSPGVDNGAAAAPEPATLASVVMAIGGLVLLRRRTSPALPANTAAVDV